MGTRGGSIISPPCRGYTASPTIELFVPGTNAAALDAILETDGGAGTRPHGVLTWLVS